jgi:hypothetical protein
MLSRNVLVFKWIKKEQLRCYFSTPCVLYVECTKQSDNFKISIDQSVVYTMIRKKKLIRKVILKICNSLSKTYLQV